MTTVYLETSIVSYLAGPIKARDMIVAANQTITREWWSFRRHAFELFASALVLDEAGKGDATLAAERLQALSGVQVLEVSPAAMSLALALLRRGGIPAKAAVDATHIAVAAVNGMDYLLTWNCKHIANAFNLPRVYEVCRTEGFSPPFVCTPQELMES